MQASNPVRGGLMLDEAKPKIVSQWGAIDPNEGVSVVISLYNYARFIEECLESVAAQDFEQIQLIVVDDVSNRDNSLEVADTWMKRNMARFPSGILLQHIDNKGLAEARNTAFAAASCELVFVMDADNTILPSCLRKLRRAILSSNAAAAFSQLVIFGSTNTIGFADYWSERFLSEGPYIDAMALIRKKTWHQVGGYSHIPGGWEDYDFWCKLVEVKADVAYVPELLGKYRQHPESMLQTESARNYQKLHNLMSLRHPWTQLE
ncbi:glycosyl transferase [Neorhizobium sp. SOG26]|nr:glycosyl transferase [Neorhizobium sp. SOG26]